MRLLDCPDIGPRPLSEFVCAGPWRPAPDPRGLDAAAWGRHVFHRDGTPGVHREWWCHVPSGIWLVAERDTRTGAVLRTLGAAAARAEAGGDA